jgi:hypothetical protein
MFADMWAENTTILHFQHVTSAEMLNVELVEEIVVSCHIILRTNELAHRYGKSILKAILFI